MHSRTDLAIKSGRILQRTIKLIKIKIRIDTTTALATLLTNPFRQQKTKI